MKRIKRIDFRSIKASLSDIYNLKDPNAKGRLISLGDGLMSAIFNVFITGIFYTGFLTMYDISITGVGIITFIPYIASCFSVFSSIILERIKKRKKILIWSKIYFYFMYIIATTVMPVIVTDPNARLVWFIIILFLAYAVYALFSPGFTPWFYFFYPADNERRTRYITLNQTFSSVMSSVVLLVSGLITDAVSGSAFHDQLIIGLRYFAFVLVLIDVWMQAQAVEYDYPPSESVNLKQVFVEPFKYKKFLMCMLLMFYWNFVSTVNVGLWSFHLLNHMNFSYTLINAMSVMYTVILIATGSTWRKLLRRYSWVKTFGIAVLFFVPTEILCFLMTPKTSWLYVPVSTWQNIMQVGLNLSYSNILYMNLPEKNSTSHIAFYCIGYNLFAFLGLIFGTWISGFSGDTPFRFLGMDIYSVQYTTLVRAVLLLIVGLVCVKKWRVFTRDEDIREIEQLDAKAKHLKEMKLPKQYRFRLPFKH